MILSRGNETTMQNVERFTVGIVNNIRALEGQIGDSPQPNSFQIYIKAFADGVLKR